MNMDSTPHFELVRKLILTRGSAFATSGDAIQQQLAMDRSNICFAVDSHFAHAPFSLSQVQELNALRARHLKAWLKLPAT